MIASKRLAIFLLVLVFIMGFLAGALLTPLIFREVSGDATVEKSASPAAKPSLVDQLADELSLNPQQKTQLREIVSKNQEQYCHLSAEYKPRYDAIRTQTYAEIMQILDGEQTQRFQKYIERQDQERRKKHESSTHNDD